jgi:hypothetical protein
VAWARPFDQRGEELLQRGVVDVGVDLDAAAAPRAEQRDQPRRGDAGAGQRALAVDDQPFDAQDAYAGFAARGGQRAHALAHRDERTGDARMAARIDADVDQRRAQLLDQ